MNCISKSTFESKFASQTDIFRFLITYITLKFTHVAKHVLPSPYSTELITSLVFGGGGQGHT